MDIISINTRKYSALVHRILDEYNDIAVCIDGAVYEQKDIPRLKELCTNRLLLNTINFSVTQDKKQIFGFHDHPSEFWADISQLEFVKQLQHEALISYRIYPTALPLWQRVLEKLRGVFRNLF